MSRASYHLAIAAALLLVLPVRGARAAPDERRIAVIAGNDLGAPGEIPLRFAQRDASRVAQVQHPTFRFDISGHGEVILTDLREAEALLRLSPEVTGHIVVTEKGSPSVVIEAAKRGGRALQLALPAGRYVVHVRAETAVYVAEAILPWGGDVELSVGSFVPRSYQTVALKGEYLEIHRHAVSAAAGISSPPVLGMGAVPVLRLQYGFKVGPLEIGPRLVFWRDRLAAVDTAVVTTAIGGGLVLAYARPLSRVDLLFWAVAEGQAWRQEVSKQGQRRSVVLGTGVRIPLTAALFAQTSIEARGYLLPRGSGENSLRPVVSADLARGVVF